MTWKIWKFEYSSDWITGTSSGLAAAVIFNIGFNIPMWAIATTAAIFLIVGTLLQIYERTTKKVSA
jgi:hypothetical protein